MSDPNRATLVSHPYRYAVVDDPTVKAINPAATEIELATNLNEAGATALAQSVFDAASQDGRVFEVKIAEMLSLTDFIDQPPRYDMIFDRHPVAGLSTGTIIGATIDYDKGTTTLRVRR